jgi:tetratricopeptide (TPR) repeat protein
MKLGKYILGLTLAMSVSGFAQDDWSKECKEARVIGGDAMANRNYQEAVTFYKKAEQLCPLDSTIYMNLRYGYEQLLGATEDANAKKLFTDSIIGVFERYEKNFGRKPQWAIWHAYYMTSIKSTNYKKIDELFKFAIDGLKEEAEASLISTYYYNLYILQYSEKDEAKKKEYSKRIVDEYLNLSKLLSAKEGNERTQEYLTGIFDRVAKSCEDVTPVIADVLNMLPTEVSAKKEAVKNYMSILERKDCVNSKEYEKLLNILIDLDPTVDAMIAKGNYLLAQKRMSEAMDSYKKAKEMDNGSKSDELNYRIAYLHYQQNNYKAAHNTALTVGGEFRSKAYDIAAKSVAATANSCGDTSFERKANYWYAVELAEKGGLSTSSYKANCPTKNMIFDENQREGESIQLSCWGVSVKMIGYN